MKITIYTITDCQFSKQEKEYLNTNKLTFEEKNLETNREFLTEMLAVSNNFAGTPVTKIEKDDGQITVLKGFTKEEFDKVLGLGADTAKPAPAPEPAVPAPAVEQPKVEVAPAPPAPAAPAPAAPPSPTPTAPVAPADPMMANILTNLQQQANAGPTSPAPAAPEPVAPPAPAPAAPAVPAAGMPNIPDPKL